MKKIYRIIFSAAFIIMSVQLFAQAPEIFNYQAALRTSGGAPLDNHLVNIRFTIRDIMPTGTNLYQETHSTTTNQFGLVNLQVGGGTWVSGAMQTIVWPINNKYLEVEVDTGGGYVSIGATPLLSVPYALYANSALNGLPSGALGNTLLHDGLNWTASSFLKNYGKKVSINSGAYNGAKSKFAIYGIENGISSNVTDTNVALHLINLNSVNGYATAMGFSISSVEENIGAKIAHVRTGSQSVGDLAFYTKDSTVIGDWTKERMRITSDGKMGIGSANPYRWLSISGNDSVLASISTKTPVLAGLEFNRVGSGGADWRIAVIPGGNLTFSSSWNEFGEGTGTGKTDVLQLTSFSLIPFIDNSMTLGSPSRRWSAVYAINGTINTSDARDKTDIKDLKYGISEVMKLRPVSFNWKTRPQDGAKLGFIAQEVEPILNEVVKKEYLYDVVEGKKVMKDEYKYGIYYSDIIPVLTKAIQEQQAIIEDLQNQVKALNEKVDKLVK